MAEQYATTPHGVVLVEGLDVWFDYIPEPDVNVPFKALSGGRVHRTREGAAAVQFRQTVPGGDPDERVVLIATSRRPGLVELVRLALEAAGEARGRASREAKTPPPPKPKRRRDR